MASELKELVFKMNRLDCYKRYAMHKMLRDSGVYFGQLSLLNSFLNRLIDNISEDAPSEKAIFEMMMKSHEKGGDDNV